MSGTKAISTAKGADTEMGFLSGAGFTRIGSGEVFWNGWWCVTDFCANSSILKNGTANIFVSGADGADAPVREYTDPQVADDLVQSASLK